MSGGIALGRLKQEHKEWRKDHPYGFFARPEKKPEGGSNLMAWRCGVPGKAGTIWEGGTYKLRMTFSPDYPTKPPIVSFDPPLFHPNVYPDGKICLSIINEAQDWRACTNVKQILVAVQNLLDAPNNSDPAQRPAHELYKTNRPAYDAKIKAIAAAAAPS